MGRSSANVSSRIACSTARLCGGVRIAQSTDSVRYDILVYRRLGYVDRVRVRGCVNGDVDVMSANPRCLQGAVVGLARASSTLHQNRTRTLHVRDTHTSYYNIVLADQGTITSCLGHTTPRRREHCTPRPFETTRPPHLGAAPALEHGGASPQGAQRFLSIWTIALTRSQTHRPPDRSTLVLSHRLAALLELRLVPRPFPHRDASSALVVVGCLRARR